MKSENLFFDSNIYIRLLRNPLYLNYVESFFNGSHQFVLNKIVLMELWAGAKTKTEEKILKQHQKTIPLIGLTDDHFITAGQLIKKMNQQNRIEPNRRCRLTWDILIALSAWENKAVVVSENEKDFFKIKNYLDFDFIPFRFPK